MRLVQCFGHNCTMTTMSNLVKFKALVARPLKIKVKTFMSEAAKLFLRWIREAFDTE